ncbi:hypothetical protein [Peribacillus simplex]|uniref:hypothetical protein n=1 Tax=Peribacillus simplex TaxID=1478 RepID=UPI003D29514A
MTKTVSDTITTPGTILTFFITVANTGTTPLTNLTVTDTLPAGTTFISANAPGGFTTTTPPVGGTGTVTFFSSNPIPPLGTVSFQIAVMVVNIGIINNTATASADGVAPVTTPPTTTIVGD